MSDELYQQDSLEERLKSGEYGEEEPEAESEVGEEEELDYEVKSRQLEERLSQLEEENRTKSAAIAEERERRRVSESNLQELLSQIKTAGDQSRQAQQEPIPDPEEDEIGYIRHQVERQNAILEHLLTGSQQAQTQAQQQNQAQAVVQAYLADIERVKTTSAPDIREAMSYLYNSRKQELEAMGYNDPQLVHQSILNEEMAIVGQSLMSRASPAERFYTLAKMRGYQPQAQSQDSRGAPVHSPRSPKSLAGIPGASPATPETFEAKVSRVAASDMHEDIMRLDPKELDKILKRYTVK